MAVNEGADALLPRVQDALGRDEGYWRCRGLPRQGPGAVLPVGSVGPALAQIAEARKICARCPVLRACLASAMATGQEYGIWGGLTEDERRRLRRWRAT